MEEILKKVRDFAAVAHGKQMRKYTPEPYIVHPERVMQICRAFSDQMPVLAAALLHDVLEDTPVTEAQLLQFLEGIMGPPEAQETLHLVIELTDVFTKSAYPQWNRKVRKEKESFRLSRVSGAAQTVKYADIIDNCREILKHDRQFGPRFLGECRQLLSEMKDGHPVLYRQALDAAGMPRAGN